MSASVDAIFSYRFTQTMQRLARSQVFPPLDAECVYDRRSAMIRCIRQLPMIFTGGHWKLDLPMIN